ncbi:MAG TPA: hypothetical protein VHA13_05985, partial [Gammaproteobacteria bacterium]|nr:hypothetical protein [Gammaproteobacteria bacterium]
VRANLHLDKLVAICCEITDVGAEKIAECSTIPDVHLNQNYIHEKGVDAMIKNPYFSEGTFLSLGIGNPINDTRALKEKQASFKLGK